MIIVSPLVSLGNRGGHPPRHLMEHLPITRRSFTALATGALLLAALFTRSSFGLSAMEEAKMSGQWFVKNPTNERIYIISGRNLKLTGGKLKDESCLMQVLPDGSYLAEL